MLDPETLDVADRIQERLQGGSHSFRYAPPTR